MKLFFCPSCQDVLKIVRNERTCSCGASSGFYHSDGLNATVKGEAVPLGFGNTSFVEALENRPASGGGERFVAFVIPKVCPTVKESSDAQYERRSLSKVR